MSDTVSDGLAQTVVVIGRLQIDAADLHRVEGLVDGMMEHAAAEPGCELYVFSRDRADPTVLHIAEEWTNQAALDAHVASEHFQEWARVLAEVTVHEREVRVYSVSGRTIR